MDTDVARNVLNHLRTTHGQLLDSISLARQQSTSLEQSWISSSASEFQGEFADWEGQINSMASAMETLANQLEFEINEWEAAASALGG
jgi:uncharacterized protein YukE